MTSPKITDSITQNDRQRLAEVLKWVLVCCGKEPYLIARLARAPRALVDDWLDGKVGAIPNSDQWRQLKKAVAHELGEFSDLRQRAISEEQAERAQLRASREQDRSEKMTPPKETPPRMSPPPSPTTSLGEKLRPIVEAPGQVAVVPNERAHSERSPQTPEVERVTNTERLRRLMRDDQIARVQTEDVMRLLGLTHEQARSVLSTMESSGQLVHAVDGDYIIGRMPERTGVDGRAIRSSAPGTRTREATAERCDFARSIFMQRPHASLNGRDGVVEMLRQRFGMGLDPNTLKIIRDEVRTAKGMRPTAAAPPTSSTPPSARDSHVVSSSQRTNEHAPRDPADDVQQVVELLLSAIPDLKTFSVTVDDAGEASIDYTVRQIRVVETGGNLKLSTRKDPSK